MIMIAAAFARVLLQRSVLVLLAWTAATHPTNALHHRVGNSRCVLQQQQQQQRQQQQQQQQHPSRRRFSVVVVAGALVSPFPVAAAAAANPVGEAIRRGASSIPGYGPPDVVYPAGFVGRWAVTRQTNDVASETTRTVSYDMRFLPTTSSEGAATTTAAAIQDRGYNLVKETAAANKNNPVRSYEWTETNPNDLRLVLNDGTGMEIKVTKRSTETTTTTDTVVTSSEFARITTDRGTIPVIEARRTLQKWKMVSANVVEGLEIVYDVGGKLGDPMAMSIITSSSENAGPRVISKSRLHLERIL
jgi:hypothetical protein